jgi:hypothetical protein
MVEKRRYKRYAANITLNISDLFNQEQINVGALGYPIQITDISKDGIGFHSKEQIPLDYYFNAMLDLGSGDNSILYTVVKIIRCRELEDGTYAYGCQFVGMASILNYVFDEYAAKSKEV